MIAFTNDSSRRRTTTLKDAGDGERKGHKDGQILEGRQAAKEEEEDAL